MLTGKWTPMNANVQKFNQLVEEMLVHSGENGEYWMTRVEILFRTHTGENFKHKSAWLFLKGKYKWKNTESTLARRNHLRVSDEEPNHFGEDALPRPPGLQRIFKSQRSSNSTASSGSNPLMYQEMIQQQYVLDRKAKMEVIERDTNERMRLPFSKDCRRHESATNRHTQDGSGRRGYHQRPKGTSPSVISTTKLVDTAYR
ncbi:hypothetical protein Tco_0679778 [Tanacetum coccineum]|uniref:Uncharacterized protein n=1 Tax=Tanacetum coccineum TaxID=301880 RepID=A0ABQ4XIS4_9ASTR